MNGAQQIHAVLDAAMSSGNAVHVLSESLTLSPACSGLVEAHPDRVHLLPAADATLIGVAVGMAIAGKRPVVELAGPTALWGALQQLGQEAAAMSGEFKAPVVVRVATGPGDMDPTQLLDGIDGITVASPSSAGDAAALLQAALQHDSPTVLIESHAVLNDTNTDAGTGLGQARVVLEGTHVSLLAWGAGVQAALTAAKLLSREGIAAEVVDLRSLRPLDIETVGKSVRKTGRVVVVGCSSHVFMAAIDAAFLRLESPPTRAEADPASIAERARAAVQF